MLDEGVGGELADPHSHQGLPIQLAQVEITQRVLYVAGRVTPLARSQFEARGFIVSDGAQAELYK